MNTTLIIGKAYFFRGNFYDRYGVPRSLDTCKFTVRDDEAKIVLQKVVQPIAEGVYENIYTIAEDDVEGTLLISFEGVIGNLSETTERIRVSRRW